MEHAFAIGESLRFGWAKVKAHSGVVFGVILTLFALEVASSVVRATLQQTPLGFVATLVLFAASVVLGIGATRIMLLIAQGEHAEYKDIIPPVKFLWPYIGAGLLVALCVICGLVLLIVPGIWVAIRLSMVKFAVLDGAGIRESVRKSWDLTRGRAWHLFLLFVVILLLNLLGMLLFLVGLLVTIPVSTIAFAHVYQKLKKAA